MGLATPDKVTTLSRGHFSMSPDQGALDGTVASSFWEDADDFGPPLDLAVDPFERIGNRYEMSRCQRSRCGVLDRGIWCDHRDRGTGSTKCGQADVIR